MAKPYRKQPDDRIRTDLTRPGQGEQIRDSLMEKNRVLSMLAGDSDSLVPSGGAAPVDEPYVTIGNTAGLSAERALTGTANQVIVTDNGADSTVVLSIPPQPLLSAFHSDTLPGTVARGDIIIGNSTPKWTRLVRGAAGSVLFSDGTDISWVVGILFEYSSPQLTGIWTWAIDSGGYIQFIGDYSLDPLLIELLDNNAGQRILLRGPGIGIGIADRVIRFPDASGTYVLVGDDADPPAAGFIGRVNRTGQTAAIGATTLADSGIANTYFVVHYTLETTTSAVGAGTIQFQINYTDDVGATTQVSAALALTATGRTRGTLEVWATGGITYQTNLVGIMSTSQYALRVRCENLG
jgi:hypothetical protein